MVVKGTEAVCADIRSLLERHLCENEMQVDVVVSVFGSAVNGFGDEASDVDVVLEMTEQGCKDSMWCCTGRCGVAVAGGRASEAKWLEEVRRGLTETGVFVSSSIIGGARVPILKLWHRPTEKPVDISVNNVDALANSNLLCTYAAWDPRVRELGASIKSWAKDVGVCGAASGWLSSYDIVLMVIFFLQVTDFALPSAQELLPDHIWSSSAATRGFLRASAHRRPPWGIGAGPTVDELRHAFFKFYATDFKWGEDVVSVRLGLPERLDGKRATRNDMAFEKLSLSSVSSPLDLDIEDPFLLRRNLSCHFRPGSRAFDFKKALELACDATAPVSAAPLAPSRLEPAADCGQARAFAFELQLLYEEATGKVNEANIPVDSAPQIEDPTPDRNLVGKASVDSRMWRILRSAELMEKINGNEERAVYAKSYREKFEGQLLSAYDTLVGPLTQNLHQSASPSESKVFYAKVRGDHHRYLAGVKDGATREDEVNSARLAYEEASMEAKALTPSHPLRLDIVLEFSVFHQDSQNLGNPCKTDRDSFNTTIANFATIGEDWYTSSTLKLRLLRNLLALWPMDQENPQDSGA